MDTARWAGLWVYLKAKLKGPTGDLAVRCAGKRGVQDDPKVFDFGSSKDRVARRWGGQDRRPVRPLGGDAEQAPDQGGSAEGAHGCAERCPAPPRCALDAGPHRLPRSRGSCPARAGNRRRRVSVACPPPLRGQRWGGLEPEPPPTALSSGLAEAAASPGPRAVVGGGVGGVTSPAPTPRAPRAAGDSGLVESEACGGRAGRGSLSLTRPGEPTGPSGPQHSSL